MGYVPRRSEQPTEDDCLNEVAAGGGRQIVISPRHLPLRRDPGRPLDTGGAEPEELGIRRAPFKCVEISRVEEFELCAEAGLTQQLTMYHLYS